MSLEDLVITNQLLGIGRLGYMFVGKLGKIKVAANRLLQSESESNNLIREASILKRLRHGKHIAYIYGLISKGESLYMVMEYSERGDLQNYLEENKESVTYEQKILFCRGILLGLLYCHSMKIYHGDIKCSNVILGKNMEPKLTDFGLSMIVDNIAYHSKLYVWTLYWTAPEILFIMEGETVYQEFIADPYPCDVYSLGATFCEISYDGTTEFIDSDEPDMDIILGIVSPISKGGFLEEIVDGCCQFECNERISLDKCLTMLDAAIEKQLLVPAMDDKWQEAQQDIQVNSKLELPHSFILHRPVKNLVVGQSNLSLLEWLCISDFKDAVEYMIQPYKDDQDQIKWLLGISELCKSLEVTDFLRIYMQNSEPSHLVLSNLIDNHPQQFVEMLIKAGASSYSYALLKKAIDRRHNMIVQAVIDTTGSFNDLAAYHAISFGNAEAVKIIVDASVDLELKDLYTDRASLIAAIDIENIEIVKILLEVIINTNSKNNSTQISVEAEIQYRLLHLAALKDNREIVKLLIDAGANIDITSSEWFSLSQDLEQQGNVSMARFIRNSISKVSSTVENNPLCAATQKKQSDLVQRLIVDGEDIDGIDLDGYAPLHWAVLVGNEEAVGILIRAGVDLDIKTSNKTQNLDSAFASDCLSDCTPLHVAISKGYLGIVKILIESGADFSAKNGLQQTIMDIAKEDKKKIEKIVRECAPINIISIRRAMKSMSLENIKVMIENQQNNAEILSECLCIAASSGKNDLIEYLLKCGVNINKEHRGKTPLLWAIFERNVETVKFLINAGADINAKNQDGEAPLFQYVKDSNIEMVQFLIDKGADVNAGDKGGFVPIHFVKSKEIAEILISRGADINARGIEGRTPLIECVNDSLADMVQFLIEKGADVNFGDKHGNAPICYTDDKIIMEVLINAGADVNAKKQYGRPPLIQPVSESNRNTIQFLAEKGTDVNVRDKVKSAPVYYINDRKITETLINTGADVNLAGKNKRIPLFQYVLKSKKDIVRFLISKGADVNSRDEYFNTPLHYARNREIAEILLDKGANINAAGEYGKTPVFEYVERAQLGMVRYLIGRGADVNVRDGDGNKPIHYTSDKKIMAILTNADTGIDEKGELSKGMERIIPKLTEISIIMEEISNRYHQVQQYKDKCQVLVGKLLEIYKRLKVAASSDEIDKDSLEIVSKDFLMITQNARNIINKHSSVSFLGKVFTANKFVSEFLIIHQRLNDMDNFIDSIMEIASPELVTRLSITTMHTIVEKANEGIGNVAGSTKEGAITDIKNVKKPEEVNIFIIPRISDENIKTNEPSDLDDRIIGTLNNSLLIELVSNRAIVEDKRKLEIMWKLSLCEGILTFHGLYNYKDKLYLVTERTNQECPTLDLMIERKTFFRNWGVIRSMSLELANAIGFMHKCNIFHKAICSSNICIVGDRHVRIYGFEYAQYMSKKTDMLTGAPAQIKWTAPERLKAPKPYYDEKCDIYSLGAVMWSLATHEVPHGTIAPRVIRTTALEVPKSVPKEFAAIIEGCIDRDREKRWHIEKIIDELSKLVSEI